MAAGSGALGLSVIVSVPEPATVKGCARRRAGERERRGGRGDRLAEGDGDAGAVGSTPVARLAGLVVVTLGAVSTGAPLPVVKLKLKSDGRVVGRVVRCRRR